MHRRREIDTRQARVGSGSGSDEKLGRKKRPRNRVPIGIKTLDEEYLLWSKRRRAAQLTNSAQRHAYEVQQRIHLNVDSPHLRVYIAKRRDRRVATRRSSRDQRGISICATFFDSTFDWMKCIGYSGASTWHEHRQQQPRGEGGERAWVGRGHQAAYDQKHLEEVMAWHHQ